MGIFVFLFLAVPLAALVAATLDGVLLREQPLDSDDLDGLTEAGTAATHWPDALWMRDRRRGLVLVPSPAAISESVAMRDAA